MYLLINWACYVQFGCENVHRYVYTNTHENTHTLASSIFQVSDKLKNEEMSKQSCISSGILKNPGWRTDSSQCCLCIRDYVCHGSELLICMWGHCEHEVHPFRGPEMSPTWSTDFCLGLGSTIPEGTGKYLVVWKQSRLLCIWVPSWTASRTFSCLLFLVASHHSCSCYSSTAWLALSHCLCKATNW
jgi:hypothetical protein